MEKIAGVHDLRFEDQQRVEKKVAEIGGAVAGSAGKGAGKGQGSAGKLVDFEIGYAPSSRAKCRRPECPDEKIQKDELRISVKQVDPEKPHLGPIPRWHHVGCFKKVRKDLDWKVPGSETFIGRKVSNYMRNDPY